MATEAYFALELVDLSLYKVPMGSLCRAVVAIVEPWLGPKNAPVTCKINPKEGKSLDVRLVLHIPIQGEYEQSRPS
jgi:hypothetical protein